MKTLAYFCNYFPFGQKEPLAETELWELSKHYDRVYIFPFYQEEDQRSIPPNAELIWFNKSTFTPIKTCQSWNEIHDLWHDVPELSNFQIYLPKVVHRLRASRIHAAQIIATLIQGNQITLFSPWVFPWGPTLALVQSVLRQNGIASTSVLRANGADLYPERLTKTQKLLQLFAMHHATKILPVSLQGAEVLIGLYPRLQSKISVAYHGISNIKLGPIPENSVLKWVSCSNFHPVKQLHRIVSIAREFSEKIEWTHFGGTPWEIEQFRKSIIDIPSNLHIHFAGRKKQQEILKEYQTQAFHLFLNVSDTEGLPLSAVEALHAGIPVLLSDVGGSSEIGPTISVQPFNPKEWKNVMVTMRAKYTDPEWRNELQKSARTLFSVDNYSNLINAEIKGTAVMMDDNLPGFSIAQMLIQSGVPSTNIRVIRKRIGRMGDLSISEFNASIDPKPWVLFPLNESHWEQAKTWSDQDVSVIPTFNPQSFDISTNKNTQIDWAKQKGIPTIPSTDTLNPTEWNFTFPIIVKPKNKGANHYLGARLWIINNVKEWDLRRSEFEKESIIIQPYFEKASVSAGVGYRSKEGVITSLFSAKRVRCYPDHYSVFSSVFVTPIPEILAYCTSFLEDSSIYGVFEIEFLEADGQYFFLELNNRATTWIGAAFWSGTNPIADAWEESQGRKPSIKKQTGSGWWIHKKNEIGNLRYKPTQIFWLINLWLHRRQSKWI